MQFYKSIPLRRQILLILAIGLLIIMGCGGIIYHFNVPTNGFYYSQFQGIIASYSYSMAFHFILLIPFFVMGLADDFEKDFNWTNNEITWTPFGFLIIFHTLVLIFWLFGGFEVFQLEKDGYYHIRNNWNEEGFGLALSITTFIILFLPYLFSRHRRTMEKIESTDKKIDDLSNQIKELSEQLKNK